MEAPIYHLDKVVKAKQEDMEDFDGENWRPHGANSLGWLYHATELF